MICVCVCVCVYVCFQAFGGFLAHSLEAGWWRADKCSSAAQWMFNGTNCEYLMSGRESHMREKDVDTERRSETIMALRSKAEIVCCNRCYPMQNFFFSYEGLKTVFICACFFPPRVLLILPSFFFSLCSSLSLFLKHMAFCGSQLELNFNLLYSAGKEQGDADWYCK